MEHEHLARQVLERLSADGLMLATAESCTGGMIAACLTAIPGSSRGFEAGFVTYSNEAKTAMLGVPGRLIAAHGAVSREVAEAMALGALQRSRAAISVAVTGIAGPDGGTETKPVGLVHLAAARRGGGVLHEAPVFEGDRATVRGQAVEKALGMVMELLDAAPDQDAAGGP